MPTGKAETLKDVFVALAAQRGMSAAMLDEAISTNPRRDLWEQAGQMSLASFSITLGLSQKQVKDLLERDLNRMMPQAH